MRLAADIGGTFTDVAAFDDLEKLLAQPRQIQRIIEALDANDMPPEDEPPLEPAERERWLSRWNTEQARALGTYSVELPKSEEKRKVKLHVSMNLHGLATGTGGTVLRTKVDDEKLPEEHRVVMDLVYYHEQSVGEVSQAKKPRPGTRLKV